MKKYSWNRKSKLLLSLVIISFIMIFSYIFYVNTKNINVSKTIYKPTLISHKDSIILGGEWFLNNQSKKFLHYEYNVTKKKHSNTSNNLRKMGALWSITRLSKYLKDQRYVKLANKGFEYFEKNFKHNDQYDFYYYNGSPEGIKVGYSAFIILSLIEIEHPKKNEYLSKFANGILYLQQESGEINPFFYSDNKSGKDYYPGEALTALMELYSYTKNETYLTAVKKAMPFYMLYFDRNKNLAFVPWQSQAYAHYFEKTNDKNAANFVFKMNDYLINANKPKNDCADYAFPYGAATSVYLEGVISAYTTAQIVDDKKRIECYGNFIREATKYAINQQITNSNDKYANGGFTSNSQIKKARVDRNQHAVMGLMRISELSLE